MRALILALTLGLQLPAATWVCPMHPDVRGEGKGECWKCGMALAPFEPDTYAPYVLRTVVHDGFRAGEPARLSFHVTHPETRAQVAEYLVVHEKPAHIFIVRNDLTFFDHVHPEVRPDGRLDITWTPPAPGRYHWFVDVAPLNALPQVLEAVLATEAKAADGAVVHVESREAEVDGVRARISVADAFAGRDTTLTLTLTDAATGAPLSALEPWLGAWAHLFAIREGAVDGMHGHPDEENVVRSASEVSVPFPMLFPRAGIYRVWTQVQVEGRVVTLPFTVRVDGW